MGSPASQPQYPISPQSLQGEAGRSGAPGEKGPNGLPVSAQGFLGAPELGLSIKATEAVGAPRPVGCSPVDLAADPRLCCRVSQDEQGPKARGESW